MTTEGSKTTPGPWYDDGYRIYAPTEDVDKRNGRMIVEYKHVDDFNPADGPLIAAAPLMLECLEAIQYWASDARVPCCFPRNLLTAVIAKAKGEK